MDGTQEHQGEGLGFCPSLPEGFTAKNDRHGTIETLGYECLHYTDSTEFGLEIQARHESLGYELGRRESPIQKRLNVYLPYGYKPGKEYPVAYLLHGITQDENAYTSSAETVNILDNIIAAGLAEPFLAIFPNGNSSSSFLNTDFSNQAGYYFFANELVKDIIPSVEARYSVARDRESRSICGFSMGGMQTINIGLCQCLAHFSRFGVLAAAPTSYDSAKISAYLERQGDYPIGLLYALCGSNDEVALASHRAAVAALPEATPRLGQGNFYSHTIAATHFDGLVVALGLYNFLGRR